MLLQTVLAAENSYSNYSTPPADLTEITVENKSLTSADAPPEFFFRIERELPFLRRIARRWYSDRTNADDLIQDTVVQALTKGHLWQPGTNLEAWLYTIMRNQFCAAIARLNRSKAALAVIATTEAEASPDVGEARLRMRDLERALRRLPEAQKSAILSVGVDGKSYEEAAQLMGMSVAALRCHLARARNRLRAAVSGGTDTSPLADRRPDGSTAPPAAGGSSAPPAPRGRGTAGAVSGGRARRRRDPVPPAQTGLLAPLAALTAP